MNVITRKMDDTKSTRGYNPNVSEENRVLYQNQYNLSIIEERLFHIKIQEITDEVIQIIVFIKELGKFGYENTEILQQIYEILSQLRSSDKGSKYIKIIHILTKYLSGIREFSSSVRKKDITFYKRLFESTLMAIMQELNSLEERVH